MALLPRDKTTARPESREVIDVSPDDVFQKDPAPKRFWELSFDGHVTHIILISFAIVFLSLAAFGVFVAWSLSVGR